MRLWGIVLCLSLSACARGGSGPTLPPPVDDATLGAGDVFDVRVYGEEELSSTYRVDSDGTIDFPLIGSIKVLGLEPPQVTALLEKELRDRQLLVDPQVSILIKEYNSKRISVIGAVDRPGTFPLTEGLTVVQAITLAGGFTNLANRNATVLTRRTGEETKKYRIAVDDVTRRGAKDPLVGPGDIIYVPERAF